MQHWVNIWPALFYRPDGQQYTGLITEEVLLLALFTSFPVPEGYQMSSSLIPISVVNFKVDLGKTYDGETPMQ